jgi:hypothetical protein
MWWDHRHLWHGRRYASHAWQPLFSIWEFDEANTCQRSPSAPKCGAAAFSNPVNLLYFVTSQAQLNGERTSRPKSINNGSTQTSFTRQSEPMLDHPNLLTHQFPCPLDHARSQKATLGGRGLKFVEQTRCDCESNLTASKKALHRPSWQASWV